MQDNPNINVYMYIDVSIKHQSFASDVTKLSNRSNRSPKFCNFDDRIYD